MLGERQSVLVSSYEPQLACCLRVRRASDIFPPRFGQSKPVFVRMSQDSGES